MHIGLVTGEYPPDEGGIGDFTYRLALALSEQGHSVRILTDRSATGALGDTPQLAVDRLAANWGWGCPKLIRNWAVSTQADIVNIQYEAAAYDLRSSVAFAPRLLSHQALPVVTTFHDLLPPYLFPKAGGLRKRVVWMLARNSTALVVTNRSDQADLEAALGARIPPIEVIPIGSNILPPTATRNGSEWRQEHGFGASDLLVGHFGFLNRTKGVETLLRAVKWLLTEKGLPIKLVFIGGRTGSSDSSNASYAQEIDELIYQLGLAERVSWTGFAEPQTISAALRAVDLVALPYIDGASLRHGTLHAALAHGVPTITTRPPVPIPELAHGDSVLLVCPGDSVALSESILSIWSDAHLRQRLAAGALRLAAQFTWQNIADRTARFYARWVMQRNGQGSPPSTPKQV